MGYNIMADKHLPPRYFTRDHVEVLASWRLPCIWGSCLEGSCNSQRETVVSAGEDNRVWKTPCVRQTPWNSMEAAAMQIKQRKWQWYQGKNRKAPKMAASPSKYGTRIVYEPVTHLSWELPKPHQWTMTLWGVMILNEEEKASTMEFGLLLILHMQKVVRLGEISVTCNIPNCICDVCNSNYSQSGPQYSE